MHSAREPDPSAGPSIPYEGGAEPRAARERRRIHHSFLWVLAHSWRRRMSLLVALCFVVIAVLATMLVRTNDKLDDVDRDASTKIASTRDAVADVKSDVSAQQDATFDAAAVSKRAAPSVFTIGAGNMLGTAFAAFHDGDDTLFVTNRHVVESVVASGAKDVQLLHNGRISTGTVVAVGKGARNDVAIVRVSDDVPLLRTSVSTGADAEEGETILAYGSPLGLYDTKTQGIVSALRDGDIQFDAPINPGNSGGPLLNRKGDVLGIITGEFQENRNSGSTGLSVALDIQIACDLVADQLPDVDGC